MKSLKIGKAIATVGRVINKNAPILLTVAGVAGVGATAIFSYKAKDKVEDVVDKLEASQNKLAEIQDIESKMNNREERLTDHEYEVLKAELDVANTEYKPYSNFEVARDIAGAVALPVFTGLASVTAIALSYYIQNNRIVNLAAALATSSAENALMRKQYKQLHGEEKYNEFISTTQEEVQLEGSKKPKVVNVAKDLDVSTTEAWFRESAAFASDDYDYNMSYITSKLESMDLRLFQRGFLTLNEVLDALDMPVTKQGALLGWSTGDFSWNVIPVNVLNRETNTVEPEPLIKWSRPVYIYDKVDYEKVYTGVL